MRLPSTCSFHRFLRQTHGKHTHTHTHKQFDFSLLIIVLRFIVMVRFFSCCEVTCSFIFVFSLTFLFPCYCSVCLATRAGAPVSVLIALGEYRSASSPCPVFFFSLPLPFSNLSVVFKEFTLIVTHCCALRQQQSTPPLKPSPFPSIPRS